MKKILLSLLIVITGFKAVFANDEKIKSGVLDAFSKKFPHAKQVSWQSNDNHYKATFNYYGAWLFAHYNAATGELLGVTRNISSLQLPLFLQNSIHQKFADYWVTNVVEESNKKGFNYYITIQDANSKVILRSIHGSDWTLHAKQLKS